MGSEVQYNKDLKIIEIHLAGKVELSDLYRIGKEYVKMSKENDCNRFLVDAFEQKEAPSFIELYDRPKFYTTENLDRRSLVAYVLPQLEDMRETARFWETVCRNRGWYVEMFETREDALHYLMAEREPKNTN